MKTENLTKEQQLTEAINDFTGGQEIHTPVLVKRIMGIFASGSVAAPKPDDHKLNEVFDKVIDKALIHTLSERLETIQSELKAAKESIKELLPILDMVTSIRTTPKKYMDVMDRAKAILDKP